MTEHPRDILYAWMNPYYWQARLEHLHWQTMSVNDRWELLRTKIDTLTESRHDDLVRDIRHIDRHGEALEALERMWVNLGSKGDHLKA